MVNFISAAGNTTQKVASLMKSCSFAPPLLHPLTQCWMLTVWSTASVFLDPGKTPCLMSGPCQHSRLWQSNFSRGFSYTHPEGFITSLFSGEQSWNFRHSGGLFNQWIPPEKIQSPVCFLLPSFSFRGFHIACFSLNKLCYFNLPFEYALSFPWKASLLSILQLQTSKLFFILQVTVLLMKTFLMPSSSFRCSFFSSYLLLNPIKARVRL